MMAVINRKIKNCRSSTKFFDPKKDIVNGLMMEVQLMKLKEKIQKF